MIQSIIKALKKIAPVLILCLGLFAISCGDDDTMEDPNTIDCSGLTPSYMNDIQPIIDATCAISGCHVAGFPSGDYTDYDGIKSKVDNGSVATRVIEQMEMPPSNTTGPDSLTTAQIRLLHCWIEDGAPNN